MQDANHLRAQAQRCRALSKRVLQADLIEQLRVWSVELADEADTVERRAAESKDHHAGLALGDRDE
jgi:hypothetical protein